MIVLWGLFQVKMFRVSAVGLGSPMFLVDRPYSLRDTKYVI